MAAATSTQLALGQAGAALNRVWQKLATTLAPTITQAADAATRALGPVADWVGQNKELVLVAAGAVAALPVVGIVLLDLGTAASTAGSVLSLAAAALGAIASPAGLATAAVAGLGAWFLTSTERGKALSATLGGELADAGRSLEATFKTTWAGIGNALKGGDVQLAAEIAFAGLEVAWEDVLTRMKVAWAGFKASLLMGWEVLKDAPGRASESLGTNFMVNLNDIGRRVGLISPEKFSENVVALLQGEQLLLKERNDALRKQIETIRKQTETEATDTQQRGAATLAAKTDKLKARVAAAAGLNAAKAGGQPLTAASLIGLGAAGPLASAFGAAGLKAGGLELPAFGDPKPPDPDGLKEILSSIVGFGGFGDLRQQFGGGGGPVKQLVDETKKLRVDVGKQAGAMDEIKGLLEDLKRNGLGFA